MDLDFDAERRRLEAVAAGFRYHDGPNAIGARYAASILGRYPNGRRALELGPAEGIISECLLAASAEVTLVDGLPAVCAELEERFPHATVVCSLIEEFQPVVPFDTIVLGHVLEHVFDPVGVLRLVRSWLADGGQVFATVPNAHSLHRQIGVLLGKLRVETDPSDADLAIGHRRVFTPGTFESVFVAAGLQVVARGGYFLKQISNAQIERDWNAELLDAAMALGERFPDIAAEIYVVARDPACDVSGWD